MGNAERSCVRIPSHPAAVDRCAAQLENLRVIWRQRVAPMDRYREAIPGAWVLNRPGQHRGAPFVDRRGDLQRAQRRRHIGHRDDQRVAVRPAIVVLNGNRDGICAVVGVDVSRRWAIAGIPISKIPRVGERLIIRIPRARPIEMNLGTLDRTLIRARLGHRWIVDRVDGDGDRGGGGHAAQAVDGAILEVVPAVEVSGRRVVERAVAVQRKRCRVRRARDQLRRQRQVVLLRCSAMLVAVVGQHARCHQALQRAPRTGTARRVDDFSNRSRHQGGAGHVQRRRRAPGVAGRIVHVDRVHLGAIPTAYHEQLAVQHRSRRIRHGRRQRRDRAPTIAGRVIDVHEGMETSFVRAPRYVQLAVEHPRRTAGVIMGRAGLGRPGVEDRIVHVQVVLRTAPAIAGRKHVELAVDGPAHRTATQDRHIRPDAPGIAGCVIDLQSRGGDSRQGPVPTAGHVQLARDHAGRPAVLALRRGGHRGPGVRHGIIRFQDVRGARACNAAAHHVEPVVDDTCHRRTASCRQGAEVGPNTSFHAQWRVFIDGVRFVPHFRWRVTGSQYEDSPVGDPRFRSDGVQPI